MLRPRLAIGFHHGHPISTILWNARSSSFFENLALVWLVANQRIALTCLGRRAEASRLVQWLAWVQPDEAALQFWMADLLGRGRWAEGWALVRQHGGGMWRGGPGPVTNNGLLSTVQDNGGQRYIRTNFTNGPTGKVSIGDFDTRFGARWATYYEATLARPASGDGLSHLGLRRHSASADTPRKLRRFYL